MKLKDRLRPFGVLYDDAGVLPVIRRSLTFMVFGNVFGSMHSIICGGGTTAVVGLATSLGASDFTFSVIMAIVQVAALLQVPFSLLVNRTQKRKLYLLTIGLISRMIWLVLGMIPFFIPESVPNYRVISLVFLIGIACSMGSVINVSWTPWLMDILPLTIQSRWLGIRDMICSLVNVVAGLVFSLLLDYLPPETKYVVIFIIGGTLGVLDMISFGFCKEVHPTPPKRIGMKETLGKIVKDRAFMKFLTFWTFWSFTSLLASVYMSPYSMNVMGLSYTQIMIFGTITAAVAAIVTVPKWGKAIFHYGSRNIFLVAGIGTSLTPLFYLFATPGSIWPTFLRNFIGALFWSGVNLAATNRYLTLSKEEIRPTYIAVFSCVTSIFGSMLGSLAAGWILTLIKSTGWFTGYFDSYKAMFVVAVVLRFIVIAVFLPGMENEKSQRPADLIRAIFRIRGER